MSPLQYFQTELGMAQSATEDCKTGGEALIWGRQRDIYYCRYSTLSDLEKVTKTKPTVQHVFCDYTFQMRK